MDIIRGVPGRYLYAACLILSFLLFYAGGVAFNHSPFYGVLFLVLAVVLFFIAVRIGREAFRQDDNN
jgi:hypothetical protein